ncbi:MATH and LRR domain-containing protein PFE0570w [Lucilia sericata]|uniref:MATH and LRR domain-containing protein PFE0570w n=1 Tax=Lucilia sericata TaxID=13632 RepID=UPI0018A84F24|nr:MATH and LRR domain-containing protein PFE0570w [Lucilia sericata]
MKLSLFVVLACLAFALAETNVPQRGLIHQIQKGVAGPNPYIFLTVPKGRSQALVQGFEVIEENDSNIENKKPADEDEEEEDASNDEEDMAEDNEEDDDELLDDEDNDEEESMDSLDKNVTENEDMEDDDDDDDELDNVMNNNLRLRKSNAQIKKAKATQMMVSREHAGAILVPDEVIEIEGQSVIDERTGKPSLLLPRAVLDSIPDGSVVALMERSLDEDEPEERANRVIVRRRRKGARRNIKRRRGGNQRRRVNRRGGNRRVVNRRVVNKRGGNKRRRINNNRRKNVRVVRRGNRRGNRRGGNKRRVNRRRVSLQG